MNTTHTFNNESTYINDCIIFAFTIITAITIYKWIQSLTNKKNNYNIDINISINHNKCKGIKKNGKPCKQRGDPNQSGGPIINGYCKYHRK